MNTRLANPGTVVDPGRIDGMEFIREEDGEVAIGSDCRSRKPLGEGYIDAPSVNTLR